MMKPGLLRKKSVKCLNLSLGEGGPGLLLEYFPRAIFEYLSGEMLPPLPLKYSGHVHGLDLCIY